jgi:hypothetical protein
MIAEVITYIDAPIAVTNSAVSVQHGYPFHAWPFHAWSGADGASRGRECAVRLLQVVGYSGGWGYGLEQHLYDR